MSVKLFSKQMTLFDLILLQKELGFIIERNNYCSEVYEVNKFTTTCDRIEALINDPSAIETILLKSLQAKDLNLPYKELGNVLPKLTAVVKLSDIPVNIQGAFKFTGDIDLSTEDAYKDIGIYFDKAGSVYWQLNRLDVASAISKVWEQRVVSKIKTRTTLYTCPEDIKVILDFLGLGDNGKEHLEFGHDHYSAFIKISKSLYNNLLSSSNIVAGLIDEYETANGLVLLRFNHHLSFRDEDKNCVTFNSKTPLIEKYPYDFSLGVYSSRTGIYYLKNYTPKSDLDTDLND